MEGAAVHSVRARPLSPGWVVSTRASRPQPLRGRLRRALTRFPLDLLERADGHLWALARA